MVAFPSFATAATRSAAVAKRFLASACCHSTPLALCRVPPFCHCPTAVPGTPHNLVVDVTGNTVSLSWSTVRDASDYVVLVGWTPATAESVMTNTSDANHSIVDLPSGKHYARVHAHNWCGTSDASEPVTFTVSQ